VELTPGTPADPFIDKMVGNFRLVRRLGAGAMGAVYEGLNPLAGIRVAVKILGADLAVEKDLVERFFAEARALNQIAHENIVRVIDLGAHPEGFYYCVMELLEGETLAAALRAGPMEQHRALMLFAQAFDALGAAHTKGIVHRDVKPTNIMLVHHPVTGVELVKLVDFGIAKLQKGAQATATQSGMIMGTPAYMSPEQASGRVQDVEARSDLYCLGLVAYEVFTGRHPFEGRAIGELIVAQMTEVPPPASVFAKVPPRLDDLLFRLLKKSKDERPESASVVATELRAILHDSSEGMRLIPPPLPRMLPAAQVLKESRTPRPQGPATEPTPTPVRIPSRQEAPSGLRKASTPLAMKPVTKAPKKKPAKRVRGPFLSALVLMLVLLGVTRAGIVDVEPIVGEAAVLLGLRPASSYGNTAMPILDGSLAAFKAAPVLGDCQGAFSDLRGDVLPAKDPDLRRRLFENLASYNRLEDCLRGHEKALTSENDWVPSYLRGVAAYSIAHALDRLSAESQKVAREIKDGDTGTAPFDAVLFARRATDSFNDARPDAPLIHRGLIDAFLGALDRMRMRARVAEAR
jgi:serine/threonine-protein kinase